MFKINDIITQREIKYVIYHFFVFDSKKFFSGSVVMGYFFTKIKHLLISISFSLLSTAEMNDFFAVNFLGILSL